MKKMELYLLLAFLFVPMSAFSLSFEEKKHQKDLTDIAKSKCPTEFIEGEDYKTNILLNGNLSISFLGEIGNHLSGAFETSLVKWNKHRSKAIENRNKCIQDQVRFLHEIYRPIDCKTYFTVLSGASLWQELAIPSSDIATYWWEGGLVELGVLNIETGIYEQQDISENIKTPLSGQVAAKNTNKNSAIADTRKATIYMKECVNRGKLSLEGN